MTWWRTPLSPSTATRQPGCPLPRGKGLEDLVPDDLLRNEGLWFAHNWKILFRWFLVLDVLNSSVLKFLCCESEPKSDPFLQAFLKTMPCLFLLVWQPISQDNLCHGVLHGSLLLILVAAAFKGDGQVIQTRALNTGGVSTVPAKETAVFWGSRGCGNQFSWVPSCSVFLRLFVLGVFLHFFLFLFQL